MKATTTRNRAALLAIVFALGVCQLPANAQKSSYNPLSWFPTKSSSKPEASLAPTSGQKADLQMTMGRAMERQGKLDEANTVYQDVLKNDSHRVDAYQRLAVVNDQLGNFAESDKHYRAGLKRDPKNAELLCDRGYSFYLQNRDAEAEQALQQALAANPHLARAHNNLALLLAHNGRDEQARAEFAKGGCREVDAHVNLAFCMMARTEWSMANQELQRAMAADPSAPSIRPALLYLRAKAPPEVAETVPLPPNAKPAIASAPPVAADAAPLAKSARVTSYEAPQADANELPYFPLPTPRYCQTPSVDCAPQLAQAVVKQQEPIVERPAAIATAAVPSPEPARYVPPCTNRVIKLAITTGAPAAAATAPVHAEVPIKSAPVGLTPRESNSEIRIVDHSDVNSAQTSPVVPR